ncbi:MAG TPA: ATP-binding cassette domain-containing protein [Spirochaetota bacterium]|nr:ATP-binding cassette domain-containing protein [Spirochaetota bacterium]
MTLINLQNIHLAFGGPALLDGSNLQIDEGNKIALLGRNGTGKSCLMKIINGDIEPDSGVILKDTHIKTALLSQEVPEHMTGTIYDVIAEGHVPVLDDQHDEQHKHLQTEKTLSMLGVNGDAETATLSAGMKRRVLLGRALVDDPDILLLDEPTNHLDLDAIQWLENFLVRYGKTILFVTHDRKFLQRVANRIVELDRGMLFDWSCDYLTFLERKDAWLDAQEQHNNNFDKKLAREEEWIRKGIKARRTRNEGRVRALKKMREERAERRDAPGTVNMDIQESSLSGKLVMEATDISFSYDDSPVVNNFSTTILRGDRVGIIGPNGCGKSTLVKLLLGKLSPRQGKVRTGTNLEIAYFDQLRDQLDINKSVKENIGNGKEFINFNGGTKHVIGYLQDFLFTPDRAAQPVSALSGGEKNRLLLAKLFTRPANLLVLDEPTNDLDLETMELLEELLLNFEGTLLLVSHDREFLNNVVTTTLGFTGNGKIVEGAGGYDEWKARLVPETKPAREKKTREKKPREKTKLTFKEEHELQELPGIIEATEMKKDEVFTMLGDPDLYKNESHRVPHLKEELEGFEAELERLYQRWDELEEMKEHFARQG